MGSKAESGGDPGPRGPEARRPADVFLPRFNTDGPVALDFAVTSGLRTNMLARSAADASAAANIYAGTKRSYLNTAQQCAEQGIAFIPMVAEGGGGGWGDDAERVWATLAHAAATHSNEIVSSTTADLYQSLSLILHREGARALLQRLPGTSDTLSDPLASARAALASAPGSDHQQ